MAGNLEALQKKLNLKFKDLNLLKQAFIHRSYLNEVKEAGESNERLEFLGDTILSFIVSTYLYSLRPGDEEGDLTNLRSYIVKTKSLATVSKDLNLGSYLSLSKGEEISGGRSNPQLLANTYEALIGAVYLDQGIKASLDLVHSTLLPLFADQLKMGPPKDAKSELQELVQEKRKLSPQYKILKTYGPDHAKRFVVGVFVKGEKLGEGSGASKQEAEEASATKALQELT